jgi:ATP-dependent Clp protease adaptor protein ClpS
MSAQVIERPVIQDAGVEKKPSPRYRVLLHNDNFNLPQNVVRWLMEVVLLGEQTAISIMMQAHTTGIGLVKVCDIEMAEFYVEQLQAKGLTMSMEPEE